MGEHTGAKILALLGVPGSGKNVIARRLLDAHGFQRHRFTDPLRDMLCAGFSLDLNHVDGEQRERSLGHLGGATGQSMFASLTRWARDVSDGRLLSEEWKNRASGMTGLILADDLQRQIEADAVHALGGLVIHVVRPGYTPVHKAALARQKAVTADLTIDNNLDRDGLVARADALALELKTLIDNGHF